MADGSLKPIEQVREGDMVVSKDEVSGKVESKRVAHAFAKHATLVLSLHLANGETVEATGDHPFYVQGRGWTPARECGIGTSIVTRAGPSVAVASVERHERDETVFNLTVEGDYSFFVGSTGLWTHNSALNCPKQTADAVFSKIPNRGQRYKTVASAAGVDQAGNEILLVAGNGKYLSRVQQAEVLRWGGTYAKGTGRHAEVNIINYAAQNGITLQTIAASRPVCLACENTVPYGVWILSRLKGR